MKKILSVIETELKQAFAACGYEESYGKAVLSNRPDLCEYQCNGAMAAAKAYKKKPSTLPHRWWRNYRRSICSPCVRL